MNKLGFYGENGIAIQKEKKHIIENVTRVLMTRRGERIGDLSFGSDLRKYLFMPEMSIYDVISEIKKSIKRCEPRVEVIDCVFKSFDKTTEVLTIELTLQLKRNKEIFTTNIQV